MANLITGALAILTLVIFLGNYAVTIASLPLWIIILAVLALAGADYFFSLRSNNRD